MSSPRHSGLEADGPPPPIRLRSALVIAVLGFLPFAGTWVYKVWVAPRPYWVHYYDPETIYFFCGLELLEGRLPHNLDNPGAPVQALSAAVLACTGRSPLAFDRFRLTVYCLTALLTFAACLLLVRTVLAGLPRVSQVAALWVYFLCPQSLEYAAVWSPETLYFPAGALAVAALWALPVGRFALLPTLLAARRWACAAR